MERGLPRFAQNVPCSGAKNGTSALMRTHELDGNTWGCWLREITREETIRGIARAAEVSHTTVRRWISEGVPPPTVWELTLKFRGDPITALVILGRITPEQVSQLNWPAAVRYADADVLTGELHRRAMRERVKPERSDAFDGLSFVSQ